MDIPDLTMSNYELMLSATTYTIHLRHIAELLEKSNAKILFLGECFIELNFTNMFDSTSESRKC